MEKFEKFTDEELRQLAFVLQQYMLCKKVDHSYDVDMFTYKIAGEIRDTIKQRTTIAEK
jgi:hypothetical protein